jgi:hypothetical protein
VVRNAIMLEWNLIDTAPFDRDLELAVIDSEGPLSRFPVVVLKAGGLRSKLRNGFTYALHTGGIGHLVNAVPVFSGASTVFH